MKKKDVILKLQQKDFVENTLRQIEREFEKIGLVFNFEATIDFENLVGRLSEDLNLIFKEEPMLFKQLLYTIDLPEKEVDRILTFADRPMVGLAELVVVRSAQKVYLRAHFSS